MKTTNKCLLAVFLATLLVAAAPAFGQQSDKAVVGKVEGTYVRESESVFIDTRIATTTRGRQVWSDVRFATPLADGRARELALMPPESKVGIGDVVEARIADRQIDDWVDVPETSRMTRLVAKRDSIEAVLFGTAMSTPRNNAAIELLRSAQRLEPGDIPSAAR